jgi:hypothetical protein
MTTRSVVRRVWGVACVAALFLAARTASAETREAWHALGAATHRADYTEIPFERAAPIRLLTSRGPEKRGPALQAPRSPHEVRALLFPRAWVVSRILGRRPTGTAHRLLPAPRVGNASPWRRAAHGFAPALTPAGRANYSVGGSDRITGGAGRGIIPSNRPDSRSVRAAKISPHPSRYAGRPLPKGAREKFSYCATCLRRTILRLACRNETVETNETVFLRQVGRMRWMRRFFWTRDERQETRGQRRGVKVGWVIC